MFFSKPPVTGSSHRLPFESLSPKKFEELCYWLVCREGYERVQYLGEGGRDKGRDIEAWKGGRRTVFQCKRENEFGLAKAKEEIQKLRELAPAEQPEELVFVVSRTATADLRDKIRAFWGCEETCNFWTGAELDERVKRYPEVVEEFFQISGERLRRAVLVIVASLIATVVVAGLVLLQISRERGTPMNYSIRVQVLSPEGRNLHDSQLMVSVGNEMQALPGGGWEVEIPSAKVPANGKITLRADHPDWEGSQADLELSSDPNLNIEIRLRTPISWIRGRVSDLDGHPRSGVLVSSANSVANSSITNSNGEYELQFSVPENRRVRIRPGISRSAIEDVYCYTGRDNCMIVLE